MVGVYGVVESRDAWSSCDEGLGVMTILGWRSTRRRSWLEVYRVWNLGVRESRIQRLRDRI